MFSFFKHHMELRSLQKMRDETNKEFEKALEDAAEDGHQEIWDGYRPQFAELDDAISSLTTDYYIREANRLMIPAPDHPDEKYWNESRFSGCYVLTLEGLAKLRSEVRHEKKERFDRAQMIFTLSIGLMGALIGLVSLWKK